MFRIIFENEEELKEFFFEVEEAGKNTLTSLQKIKEAVTNKYNPFISMEEFVKSSEIRSLIETFYPLPGYKGPFGQLADLVVLGISSSSETNRI